MHRTSAATRSRLVSAAVAEFAEHGLAGARVDRIAAAAAANKRAIYDYYGSKEGLFDVALMQVISDLNEAVPLRDDDLPGYAADLFDYLLAHPGTVRMIAWRRLERPQAGPGLSDTYVARMLEVRDRSGAAAIEPVDLVILVVGLANAWPLSSPDLLPAAGQDPADPRRIALHRSAVVEAARRMSGNSVTAGRSGELRDRPDGEASGARGGGRPPVLPAQKYSPGSVPRGSLPPADEVPRGRGSSW